MARARVQPQSRMYLVYMVTPGQTYHMRNRTLGRTAALGVLFALAAVAAGCLATLIWALVALKRKQVVPRPSPVVWDDTVLLLTCTVNPHRGMDCVMQTDPREREATYRGSVLRWLAHSPFRLVIVENSGFPMTAAWLGLSDALVSRRIHFVLFDEGTDEEAIASGLPTLPSKGAHELFAINRALGSVPVLLAQAPFVIKVTGRFFIPNFLDSLRRRQPDVSKAVAVRQADPMQCQVVGCATPYARVLFAADKDLLVPNPTTITTVETVFARRLQEPWAKGHTVILPAMPIPPTKTGGTGSIIDVL